MKLCILHCAKHDVYAISVESKNGGIRVTPNKCCGAWHTVREFKLSPAAWDELSKAAESAARRGRAARKEAAMSEMKPVACDVVDREGGTVATRVMIEYADDLLRQWEHRDSKKANFLYDERVVAELQIARAEYAGRARLAETRLIEAEQRAERAEVRVAELEALFRENARKAREQAAFEAAGAWDDAAAAIDAARQLPHPNEPSGLTAETGDVRIPENGDERG